MQPENLKDRNYSPENIDELCELVRYIHPKANIEWLRRVYEYSEKAHAGQIRRSGEP